MNGVVSRGCSQPLASSAKPAISAPRGVGAEQHRVIDAGIAMAEIGGEIRHLRLIAVGDEERGGAGQQDHRGDDAVVADRLDRHHDVGEAAHRPRRRAIFLEFRPVRRLPQPQGQRHVEQDIEQDAMRRAEAEQDRAADRGARQQAEIARGRVQPHRARQLLAADDVVEQHLARRAPEHAGEAVNREDDDRRATSRASR